MNVFCISPRSCCMPPPYPSPASGGRECTEYAALNCFKYKRTDGSARAQMRMRHGLVQSEDRHADSFGNHRSRAGESAISERP
jgi:hypothetical protein